MNDRQWLKRLVKHAKEFRQTPIVANDFPEMRDRFDDDTDAVEVYLAEKSPKIMCLCGSTRFYKQFVEYNYKETMAGNIVLSVGFYPHSSDEVHGQHIGCDDDQKKALDELHLRKIDLADEILVLNAGGYIGQSTSNEIAYAKENGKVIRYLEGA